jgi:hypothetical protein
MKANYGVEKAIDLRNGLRAAVGSMTLECRLSFLAILGNMTHLVLGRGIQSADVFFASSFVFYGACQHNLLRESNY